MKRQTTKFILNIATAIAVAMTAAAVLIPVAASAATATTNANVRSGPGTGYAVIGTLRAGQSVDVDGCSAGWCELSRGGYVSSSLLAGTGGGGGGGSSGGSGPNFSIGVGPGGVQIGIGNGPGRPGGPGGPIFIDPDDDGEVCFYDRTRFRGGSFCMAEGEEIRNLQFTGWNDRIRSFDNPDRLRVTVCYHAAFSNCRTYRSGASSLDDFDQQISSIRVR